MIYMYVNWVWKDNLYGWTERVIQFVIYEIDQLCITSFWANTRVTTGLEVQSMRLSDL